MLGEFFCLFVFLWTTSYCHSALLQILTHMPFFVQTKEAGADDILDISACELAEVNYRKP